MKRDKKMVTHLLNWIEERQNIYERRTAGKPKPWTTDPIMRAYRFCNVYREQDTVTKWIAANWRDPNTDDQDVWFAMFVARYVNEPATMELLGYPVPYKSDNWFRTVAQRKKQGANVFNAAYIIPTGGTHKTGPKHETLDGLFTYMWTNRKQFRRTVRDREGLGALTHYCKILTTVPGVGRFMAGQVIADLKYTLPYLECDDWWTFAISGPGSRRGLNRIMSRGVDERWKEDEWFVTLSDLRTVINHENRGMMDELHGQDMQNCLCEFDKWCRAKFGEGKPKQKYDGG